MERIKVNQTVEGIFVKYLEQQVKKDPKFQINGTLFDINSLKNFVEKSILQLAKEGQISDTVVMVLAMCPQLLAEIAFFFEVGYLFAKIEDE